MTSLALLLTNVSLRTGPWYAGKPGLGWVAVRGGRVVAVGVDNEPPSGPWRRFDGGGGSLIPGLVDAHTHLGWSAEDRWTVNLGTAQSAEDMLQAIGVVASRIPVGDWVTGGGWETTTLSEELLPNRAEIDRAAGDHPLFLVAADGHVGVANSIALRIAKIDATAARDSQGTIVAGDDGEPTGVLRHHAVRSRLVSGVVPPRDGHRIRAELIDLLGDLARRGVTEVHDIGTVPEREGRPPYFRERSFTDVNAVAALGDALTLRYNYRSSLLRAETFLDEDLPVHPLVSFGGYKVSLDNGWYSQPAGQSRQESFRWPGFDEAVRLARIADAQGMPVSIHAIGDLGVEEALRVIEMLGPRIVGAEPLHRVIHGRRLSPKSVTQMACLGVALEVQPWEIVNSGDRISAMGDEEFRRGIAPFRDLLRAGVPVAIGSDRRLGLRADEWDTDPWVAMQIAVQRRLAQIAGGRVFQGDQSVSLTQAVAMHSVNGVLAAGAGARRGKIAPGYTADLLILDRDLWSTDAAEVRHAHPILTLLGGNVVYGGLD